MKRDPVVLIAVGILVSAMLLFGVYKSRRQGRFTAVPASDGNNQLANQLARDFTLKSLYGQTVHLSDFRG